MVGNALINLEDAHYQCTSRSLARVLAQSPLACDSPNIQTAINLCALQTEIFLHIRTINQLLEAMDLVDQLQTELADYSTENGLYQRRRQKMISIRQTQLAQMLQCKEAYYQDVTDEYNRFSRADPIGCDACNIDAALTLAALQSEIVAHKATLEELCHAYILIDVLKKELHI